MAYQFTNCFEVNTQCIQIDPSIQFNYISEENFLGRSSSLLFIDKTVDDYQTLISGVQPGIEVHILDPTQDAITQITQTLTGRSGIESLHIVSHGSAGALNFASTNLNNNDINNYSPQLQSWQKALTSDADILLYGCDIAASESGKEFVLDISKLTGASVAASVNLTGSAALGGDWTLEYSTGTIKAPNAIQSWLENAYNHVLATFTVNSTADVVDQSDGVTTLREAINQANANRGEDTIVFDPSVFRGQAINLNLGQLNITDSLNINGSINGQIQTINGNKASRVFEIGSQATVNLSGLMIINGVTADKGGAIFNAGTLTIENSTLSNNQANSGGAIFNTASLTISKSAIINNYASKDGGGIFNDGYFGKSNLIVSYTYIGGNSANQSGGGVANFNGGAFNFSYGSITDNSALGGGGGIFNAQGTVNISYSTVKDNIGAGDSGNVVNYGTLNISNSTVSGNSANNPISISNPIKIMPLGDSITQGVTNQNSYRRLLWFDLLNAGYNVDFVGSIRWTTEGITPPTPDFDLDNEGYGGWTSQQILDNIDGIATNNRPDIVLLHIGTNDLNINKTPQSIIDNINRTIQKLRQSNPNVKVLLAQIIPDGNPDRSPQLNSLIPTLASQISTSQSPVIVVDQYSDFNGSSDTLDTYHPNNTGELKMATRWFNALKTVL